MYDCVHSAVLEQRSLLLDQRACQDHAHGRFILQKHSGDLEVGDLELDLQIDRHWFSVIIESGSRNAVSAKNESYQIQPSAPSPQLSQIMSNYRDQSQQPSQGLP